MLRRRSWLVPACIFSFAVSGFVACGGDASSSETTDSSGGSGGSGNNSSTTTSNGGGNSTSTGGGTSTSTGTGGAGGAGCKGLGDACSDCAATSCNAAYCTCYANPACGALVACAQNCAAGDAQCGQACLTANQAGISDALLLGDCANTSCTGSCTGTTKLTPCEACAFTNCPTQMNKCLANEECNQLIQCVQACDPGDSICAGGCALQFGGGTNDAQDVQACVDGACAAQCG